jgi:thiamine biosynthesis protein ThiI
VKPNLIIIRYSEIGLKAKFTRKTFENILQKNIKDILKKEKIIFSLNKTGGRFFIYTKKIKKTTTVLKKIFGIKSVSPCFKIDSSINSMKKIALKVIKDKINKDTSFALKVKREGNHDYTSQDVAIILGDEIVKKTKAKVNLSKPDIKLFIEIRQSNAFFFFEKILGPGGLPLGSQGKVLSLVKSKDNKFLATWYMIRRGCIPVFLTLEKEFIENIKTFTNKWHFNAEIVKCNKNTFYATISKVISEYGCEAVITDYFFSDNYSEILKEVTKLKNCANVPLLQPLIIMDDTFIQEKSKEIDL